MDTAWDLALRRLGAAAILQRARSAVVDAGKIAIGVVVADPAARDQIGPVRADIAVARFIVVEVVTAECAILALRFVDDGNVRFDAFFID